jgi:hypothetical protein
MGCALTLRACCGVDIEVVSRRRANIRDGGGSAFGGTSNRARDWLYCGI